MANLQVRFCSLMLFLLGLSMTVVILLQVFFRFVVYVPFPWSEECARYLMIWMGMLGSVVALRQGRHIGVRVLVEKLPGRTYDLVAPLIQLSMILFLAVIFREGITLALFNSTQNSPAMEIPMLIPYLAIPAGAGMMILGLFADILQDRFPTAEGSDANIAAETLTARGPSVDPLVAEGPAADALTVEGPAAALCAGRPVPDTEGKE